MDDRFIEQFKASADPKTKQRIAADDASVDRLVRVYQRAYASRYGTEPLVDAGGRFIVSSLRKACSYDGRGDAFAEEILQTFPTLDEEWFAKSRHSLFSLKNNLNVVIAAIGARRRSSQPMQLADPVDVILYYLYESSVWQKNRGLTKVGRNEIRTAGGHVIRKDELREYFKIKWFPQGGDGLGELCTLLDKYLKELDALTPPPVA